MARFNRRLTPEQRRHIDRIAEMLPGVLESIRNRPSAGDLARAEEAARVAAEATRAAEQKLEDLYTRLGVRPGHDFIGEAARELYRNFGEKLLCEADRKRLRVQLAAMLPSDAEHLVDETIERAERMAAADAEGAGG